jgi:Bacterial dnaA protein helix-turn-helix
MNGYRNASINLARIGALSTARDIAEGYGCLLERVLDGDRHKWPARARHHLWMVLRHTLDLSYPEIGALFGADHTTVIMGVRKAEEALALRVSDCDVRRLVARPADVRFRPAEAVSEVRIRELAGGESDEQGEARAVFPCLVGG